MELILSILLFFYLNISSYKENISDWRQSESFSMEVCYEEQLLQVTVGRKEEFFRNEELFVKRIMPQKYYNVFQSQGAYLKGAFFICGKNVRLYEVEDDFCYGDQVRVKFVKAKIGLATEGKPPLFSYKHFYRVFYFSPKDLRSSDNIHIFVLMKWRG